MKIVKNFFPIFASISIVFATWFKDIPRTITQPNGEVIDCFVTGDQYGRRLHDANDFTIMMNQEDGYYYFSYWSTGLSNKKLSWRARLRYCWNALLKGKAFNDEIILNEAIVK